MNLRINKKEKIILSTGLLLMILVFVLGYFIFLYPLKTTLAQKQIEEKNQQQLLNIVQSRNIDSNEELVESSVQLQKQIPVKPNLEQFIIDLEMAETLSNSQILQISFSEQGLGENEVQAEIPVQSEGTVENATETLQKPPGIKEITLNLSIESDSYFDLEKFIDTVENLDRIVEVKSISFAGPQEITSLASEKAKTSFQLALSIYYYPGLEDLGNQAPDIETDSPANKKNPLSNFSDLSSPESNY